METNEYQSVDGTEGEFLWSGPPQDVYLLPQRPNLCLERCPRPEQIDERLTNKSAKIPHPMTGLPDSRSTASWTRFAIGTGELTIRLRGTWACQSASSRSMPSVFRSRSPRYRLAIKGCEQFKVMTVNILSEI